MRNLTRLRIKLVMAIFTCLISSVVWADTITEWNANIQHILKQAKVNTPYGHRALALAHTAMYEACNAITKQYKNGQFSIAADSNASIQAAVAAASYHTLKVIVPQQEMQLEEFYQHAIHNLQSGTSTEQGIAIGKEAASQVLAYRKIDMSKQTESYKPRTTPGVYVPTTLPAVSYWSTRKPWALTSAKQFRAPLPPPLKSKKWAKDFNEVKSIGALNSQTRTQQQTQIGQFWKATLPPIYHGVIRSIALQPNRGITQNARLFGTASRAMDDALIAVFEGKYHYQFWRPITAIRNADIDNNTLTTIDSSWVPLIPTPMHPEYPCAHCVIAATLGQVIKAELDQQSSKTFSTRSYTVNNIQRSWNNIDDFIQEVSNARIYSGVHYRSSTEAGNAMGKKIGALAVRSFYLGER